METPLATWRPPGAVAAGMRHEANISLSDTSAWDLDVLPLPPHMIPPDSSNGFFNAILGYTILQYGDLHWNGPGSNFSIDFS
jgi:hypothetical protein